MIADFVAIETQLVQAQCGGEQASFRDRFADGDVLSKAAQGRLAFRDGQRGSSSAVTSSAFPSSI